MDSVFISSKKSPKKGIFKSLIGARSRRSNSYQSQASDALTEYFPFAGGDGVDNYEFQPDYMRCEPGESMFATDVNVEPDYSAGVRRNAQKVLLRNSKYEVYDQKSHTAERTERITHADEPETFSELKTFSQRKQRPLTHADDGFSEFWTLQWLNDLHLSVDMAIPYIRKVARASLILVPLDAISDHVEGTEILIAGLEVFLFMLAADFAARLIRFICFPAVALALIIFKLL